MFLDDLDHDGLTLQRLNSLLRDLPPHRRQGLHPVELVVIRPSEDLGRLSLEFEPQLPRAFRYMTRGLGSRETTSPDLLSLLMFQPDYIQRLLEIGGRRRGGRRRPARGVAGAGGGNFQRSNRATDEPLRPAAPSVALPPPSETGI